MNNKKTFFFSVKNLTTKALKGPVLIAIGRYRDHKGFQGKSVMQCLSKTILIIMSL